MHHKLLDANFYIVAATIIPVLFLALVLQGSTYEQILVNWQRIVKNAAKYNKSIAWALDFCSYMVAAIVLGSGFLGEMKAVLALYNNIVSSSDAHFVLYSIIALLIVVTFGPFIRLAKTMRTTDALLRAPRDDEHSSSNEAQSPDGGGAEDTSAEIPDGR